MATTMKFLVNYVNANVTYATEPLDYLEMILTGLDCLIWTAGDTVVKDLMNHQPIDSELNAAASVITSSPVTVALCLLSSETPPTPPGDGYYTHKVIGMGLNKPYVFCFYFNGPTATIPRLEAWDTSAHSTHGKNVLGLTTPAHSFVRAAKTTGGINLGSDTWEGTPIAGDANYVELDSAVLSGAKALYANIKIIIEASYATPSAETFVICVRYTYL